MVGPDLNEKICSQISPAGASLVDKEDFHATCSADRTEASSSFEPDEKDHHRLMIYRNRLPDLRGTIQLYYPVYPPAECYY